MKKKRRDNSKTKTALTKLPPDTSTDKPTMDKTTAERPATDKAPAEGQHSIQANADSQQDVERTIASASLDVKQAVAEASAPPRAMDESKGEPEDEPEEEHVILPASEPTDNGDIAQLPSAKFPLRVDDRLTLFALEDVDELSLQQLKMLLSKFGLRARSLLFFCV